MNTSERIRCARSGVERAMKICARVQADLIDEQTLVKKDRSPVTVADYASQVVILHHLKQIDPDTPTVAEEDATDLRKPENAGLLARVLDFARGAIPDLREDEVLNLLDQGDHPGGATGRFWTLDPIDGTKGFLRGDQYAVALGLIEDGQVIGGILGCPQLRLDKAGPGVLLYAVRTEGAFWQADSGAPAHPLRVNPSTDPGEWRFCEPFESGHSAHDHSAAILQALGVSAPPLRMDSQAKYGACAAGLAHAYLRLPTRPGYQEKIWDHAAGCILVAEAGGRVSDIEGHPLRFDQGKTLAANRGVIASSGVFHDALVRAIRARED